MHGEVVYKDPRLVEFLWTRHSISVYIHMMGVAGGCGKHIPYTGEQRKAMVSMSGSGSIWPLSLSCGRTMSPGIIGVSATSLTLCTVTWSTESSSNTQLACRQIWRRNRHSQHAGRSGEGIDTVSMQADLEKE